MLACAAEANRARVRKNFIIFWFVCLLVIGLVRISERISKTRNNTERFDSINTANKFNINIGASNDSEKIDTIKDKSDGITWMDAVYDNLSKSGVDEDVIESLFNYVVTEIFDTEGLEIDLFIENGARGNIESHIDDQTCTDWQLSGLAVSLLRYGEMAGEFCLSHGDQSGRIYRRWYWRPPGDAANHYLAGRSGRIGKPCRCAAA